MNLITTGIFFGLPICLFSAFSFPFADGGQIGLLLKFDSAFIDLLLVSFVSFAQRFVRKSMTIPQIPVWIALQVLLSMVYGIAAIRYSIWSCLGFIIGGICTAAFFVPERRQKPLWFAFGCGVALVFLLHSFLSPAPLKSASLDL